MEFTRELLILFGCQTLPVEDRRRSKRLACVCVCWCEWVSGCVRSLYLMAGNERKGIDESQQLLLLFSSSSCSFVLLLMLLVSVCPCNLVSGTMMSLRSLRSNGGCCLIYLVSPFFLVMDAPVSAARWWQQQHSRGKPMRKGVDA